MNESQKYKTYPFSVRSRDIYKYIRRDIPCIIFYNWPLDSNNSKLVNRVKYVSKFYPYVLCYKVGWTSDEKINKKSFHEFNEVSLWKKNKKEIYLPYPNTEQLYLLFSIVNERLCYLNPREYVMILNNDRWEKSHRINEKYTNITKQIKETKKLNFIDDKFTPESNLSKDLIENEIISNMSLISELNTPYKSFPKSQIKSNINVHNNDRASSIRKSKKICLTKHYRKIEEINAEKISYIGSLYIFKDMKIRKTVPSIEISEIST